MAQKHFHLKSTTVTGIPMKVGYFFSGGHHPLIFCFFWVQKEIFGFWWCPDVQQGFITTVDWRDFFANEFFVCQEEQHSGSSANYDVEIVHSSQVHMEQAVASKIARLPPYHNHVWCLPVCNFKFFPVFDWQASMSLPKLHAVHFRLIIYMILWNYYRRVLWWWNCTGEKGKSWNI